MFGEMPLPCGPVPGNSLLSGDLQQRIPVARRIVFAPPPSASGAVVAVRFRRLARRRFHFRRIHQAVAAHPHRVVRFRQIGQQVAPAIVGDHDLGELASAGPMFPRSPRRPLPALRAGDHASDVVVVDTNRFSSPLPGLQRAVRGGQTSDKQRRRQSQDAPKSSAHFGSPLAGFPGDSAAARSRFTRSQGHLRTWRIHSHGLPLRKYIPQMP